MAKQSDLASTERTNISIRFWIFTNTHVDPEDKSEFKRSFAAKNENTSFQTTCPLTNAQLWLEETPQIIFKVTSFQISNKKYRSVRTLQITKGPIRNPKL